MKARILLAAAGLLLGGLGAAGAHAFLDQAEPRVGSTVKAAPTELRLWFTDDLDPAGTGITVLDEAGKPVPSAKAAVDAKNDRLVTLALPALPPGRFRVVWQATCDYGHVTNGDFAFTVKP